MYTRLGVPPTLFGKGIRRNHTKPTIQYVRCRYPLAVLEVSLPTWVLRLCNTIANDIMMRLHVLCNEMPEGLIEYGIYCFILRLISFYFNSSPRLQWARRLESELLIPGSDQEVTKMPFCNTYSER